MIKREIGKADYAGWLETARACRGLVFKGVDLRADDWRLVRMDQAARPAEGCVFIDCQLGPMLLSAVGQHYGIVFPDLGYRVFHAYREQLYSPEELFAGFDPAAPETYRKCPDWRIFESYIRVDGNYRPLRPMQYVEAGADELICRRLHDHFINAELNNYLAAIRSNGRGVVAFMGGHDSLRSAPVYLQIAKVARRLARLGYLVSTGGGPGLMEAANLGSFLSVHSEEVLVEAVRSMATPDADRYDHPQWLAAAWRVRQQWGPGGPSLGVPTWFYGHEPPNVFASAIAKYFENSFREEGLLAIASHGIVFAEGNAGTVQEIFQDGCQNYYDTYGHKSPMILFGEEYWNPSPDAEGNYPGRSKPAWPLLRKLAQEKGFLNLVAVTSDPEEVVARITAFAPPPLP